MRRYALVFSALACLSVLGCGPTGVGKASADWASVDWPTTGGDSAEQHSSPLTTINANTISRLKLAWSYEFDTNRGQEATPIVIGGVMYVSSAWSKVFALDATSGHLLWSFDPKVPGEKAFDACCDVVNRGVAVADGKVFVGALDGRLIALDARSGHVVWSQQTVGPDKPYTITGAPRVFKGKVVIGNGGADYGVRGFVTAYDTATGRKIWRFYTVPGDPKKAPDGEASDEALKKLALPTWFGKWYEYGGGGTVWDSIVYDAELDQLYLGVGNGSVWDRKIRSNGKGDNLFLSSIVALNPDTGGYLWHYQVNPGDSWDFTATQQITLATLLIDGRPRKVLMQAPKNGFFYVIDRKTGKLISANNFVPVTWATGINLATGRPRENPAAHYEHPFLAEPSPVGAHNWQSMAYSPATKLVYIPAQQVPFVFAHDPAFQYKPGSWNMTLDPLRNLPPDSAAQRTAMRAMVKGALVAWNPITQRQAWRVEHPGYWNGGVLATAGNLVFQGDSSRNFSAYRADTGKVLWRFETPSQIIAAPISYKINGIQYVAVLSGWGGATIGSAAGAQQRLAPNGRVLVFRLNGTASLPPYAPPPLPPANPSNETFTPEQTTSGKLFYHQNCAVCHGFTAVGGDVLPDLRRSSALPNSGAWGDIVIGGALKDGGMASFARFLTPAQADAIRAYVNRQAGILRQEEALSAN